MRLVLVAGILCVVLFFAGVFSPRRSERMERWVGRRFRRGERHGADSAGKLGDLSKVALKKTRKATEHSAAAGRSVNESAGKAVDAVRGEPST
jgi:hypothetical protein